MEELVLADPVVQPEKVSNKYKVISLSMNHKSEIFVVQLEDNLGMPFTHQYTGQQAVDYIKFINTANFTTKSLHKRILEKLSTDGVLPGTVTGAPDA